MSLKDTFQEKIDQVSESNSKILKIFEDLNGLDLNLRNYRDFYERVESNKETISGQIELRQLEFKQCKTEHKVINSKKQTQDILNKNLAPLDLYNVTFRANKSLQDIVALLIIENEILKKSLNRFFQLLNITKSYELEKESLKISKERDKQLFEHMQKLMDSNIEQFKKEVNLDLREVISTFTEKNIEAMKIHKETTKILYGVILNLSSNNKEIKSKVESFNSEQNNLIEEVKEHKNKKEKEQKEKTEPPIPVDKNNIPLEDPLKQQQAEEEGKEDFEKEFGNDM